VIVVVLDPAETDTSEDNITTLGGLELGRGYMPCGHITGDPT
jgi:hypothetical protein